MNENLQVNYKTKTTNFFWKKYTVRKASIQSNVEMKCCLHLYIKILQKVIAKQIRKGNWKVSAIIFSDFTCADCAAASLLAKLFCRFVCSVSSQMVSISSFIYYWANLLSYFHLPCLKTCLDAGGQQRIYISKQKNVKALQKLQTLVLLVGCCTRCINTKIAYQCSIISL